MRGKGVLILLVGKERPMRGRGEGSKADMRQDKAGARKKGVSLKAYEGSAADRRADKARMAKRGKR
jgi:hypothetical protein